MIYWPETMQETDTQMTNFMIFNSACYISLGRILELLKLWYENCLSYIQVIFSIQNNLTVYHPQQRSPARINQQYVYKPIASVYDYCATVPKVNYEFIDRTSNLIRY